MKTNEKYSCRFSLHLCSSIIYQLLLKYFVNSVWAMKCYSGYLDIDPTGIQVVHNWIRYWKMSIHKNNMHRRSWKNFGPISVFRFWQSVIKSYQHHNMLLYKQSISESAYFQSIVTLPVEFCFRTSRDYSLSLLTNLNIMHFLLSYR